MKLSLALSAVIALSTVAVQPLQASIVLFEDTFNRPDDTNLNASSAGKSGVLGPLNYVEVNGGGTSLIVGDKLRTGDAGAGGGWAVSYVDHNFIDSVISDGGGFSVSLDVESYSTAGTGRFVGLAVGMSKAELDNWAGFAAPNTPSTFTTADLFVGYRGTTGAFDGSTGPVVAAYESGVSAFNNTTAGSPATLPKTLDVDFKFSDFNDGSTVDYTVLFGGVQMGTGSFQWDGSNQNYIGIYSNVSSTSGVPRVIADNFQITAVPEPGRAVLLGMAALGLLLRRRRS